MGVMTETGDSGVYQHAAWQQAQMTRAYIADLELQIERLKRHNVNYNPEYDPERDKPLDAAWEEGNRAAWRDVAGAAFDKLFGGDHDRSEIASKIVLRLDRVNAETTAALRELWHDHMEAAFPDDLYLPDVIRLLQRRLTEFALDRPDDEDDDDAA